MNNYWATRAVPIPADAYHNKNDGRIYIKVSVSEDRQDDRRIVIGKLVSEEENTFLPNREFGTWYPLLWKEYYGYDPRMPSEIHSGIYIAVLAIVERLKLYSALIDNFGLKIANLIIDYAMYSIVENDNAANAFETFSKGNHLLFSATPYSDSRVSDWLTNDIHHEDIERFKLDWISLCKALGIVDCWWSIDASNCDCDTKACEKAIYGESKSRSGKPVIGYIWAICANGKYRGMPLAYCVNDGNMVDSNQQHTLASMLGNKDISVKGAMFDRGFCDTGDLSEFKSLGHDFLVMLKKNVNGYNKMLEKYGKELHSNSARYRLPKEPGLFGITDKMKIFANDDESAYISLIYNCVKNGYQWADVIEEWNQLEAELDAKRAETQVETQTEGKPESPKENIPVHIPKRFEGILKVEMVDGAGMLLCDYDKMNSLEYQLGCMALASSLPLSPGEMLDLYKLRDASETQFDIMKTQLGFDVMRGHSTPNIDSRFLICFVASIIRSEFKRASRETKVDLDVNSIVTELDKIQLKLSANQCYAPVIAYSENQLKLLQCLGVNEEQIGALSIRVNRRWTNPSAPSMQTIPEVPKKKRGRPPKPKTEDPKPKRKPGRPRKVQDTPQDTSPEVSPDKTEQLPLQVDTPPQNQHDQQILKKQAVGRPRRLSSTAELLKQIAQESVREESQSEQQTKRGRGRPKGSKNKPKLLVPPPKRPRGRPRKNPIPPQ